MPDPFPTYNIGSPRDRFERSVSRLGESPVIERQHRALRGQQALLLMAAGYREPDPRSPSYPFLPIPTNRPASTGLGA